jgi:hypothetical protein
LPEDLANQKRLLEIQKLRAEARGQELENAWKSGWRPLIKAIVAGIVVASAAWFYYNFYVDLQIKNYAMAKENADIRRDQSEHELSELNLRTNEKTAQLRDATEALENSKKERDALLEQVGQLKQSAAKFGLQLRELKANSDATIGATAARRRELEQERDHLAADLNETRKRLDSALTAGAGSGRIVEAHDSTIGTSEDRSNLGPGELLRRQRAALENVFRRHDGQTDFVFRDAERLRKERKHAPIESNEEVVAAVHFIFGDWLVFGTRNIYSKQSSESKDHWQMPYSDLAEYRFAASGLWSVNLEPNHEIVTAGTSFKRTDLVALLSELRDMAINHPDLFPVNPLTVGDN